MDGASGSVKESLYEIFITKFGPEVKPREGYNIKLTCPSCGKKSLSCHILKGLCNCWNCGYGKGLKFGGEAINFEEKNPVDPLMHQLVTEKIIKLFGLDPNYKEYLVKRGIYNPDLYCIKSVPFAPDRVLLKELTKEQLASSGYFYLDPQDKLVASKALESRRLLIPFWQGDKVTSFKSRIRPYADETEDERRYIMCKGGKIAGKIWYKGKLNYDTILTEGELCAMATAQAGIACCGIPGVSNASNLSTQATIKSLAENYGIKRLFIILDTDPGIEYEASKLAHSVHLYEALPEIGCIVYLPRDKETECMDLDLYLTRYDVLYLYDMLEDAWAKREEGYMKIKTRIKDLHEGRNQNTSKEDSFSLW